VHTSFQFFFPFLSILLFLQRMAAYVQVQVVGRWALSTSVGTPLARWSSPPPLPGYRAESVLQYALESAASGGAGVMRYTEHNDTSDKDNFGAGVEQFLAPELSPVAAVRVGENLVRGGFLPQRLGILVRAPQPKPPPPPVPPPTVGPPWEYTESSIFVPRAKKSSGWDILDRMSLTDARSMLDNEGKTSRKVVETEGLLTRCGVLE
jgi:hypothetical protein